MITVRGKVNQAVCYTNYIENAAEEQIKQLCDNPLFTSSKIVVMPDVHAGKGCTVGTTMTFDNYLTPSFIGVDIGCGISVTKINQKIDLNLLNKIIQEKIPTGFNKRPSPHPFALPIDTLRDLYCAKEIDLTVAQLSLGTLGSGNHFIEVDTSEDGSVYLLIHSGSRHYGYQIARAYGEDPISGEKLTQYLHDIKIASFYAANNRDCIRQTILESLNIQPEKSFTSVHNYIEEGTNIIRKGAISANKDELCIIPLNMRDGSLLCRGKGNPDWNYSAPHGAGRRLSRGEAKRTLSAEEFQNQMKEKNIYTTSFPLDEAPEAYKSVEEILSHIYHTVEVLKRLTPIYNFKG